MIFVRQRELARAMSTLREALECMRRDPQPLFASRSVELIASGLVQRGLFVDAARLHGAAAANRDRIGARYWRTDSDQHRPALAAARAALGDAAFEAAFAEGREMDIDAALALAFDAAGQDVGPAVADPTTDTSEYEVVTAPVTRAPALVVRTLGTLRISIHGVEVPPSAWGYAKARELLVYLMLRPEGRTREQVGAALWPEASAA